ncbi:hypothetical protein RB10919 [Rhodopirellula baltica SH 1]|uniref:Uncharacterized protein n=1 Tax=Rhodopirellula baltica (strain DSM 10527 / NCIMB 13988 / SH1) TaxID=243090 RepID=Q7UK19_RHOBA|nr:hypothetical protein RB10919 [Rhodopirellula baltica SH 1]
MLTRVPQGEYVPTHKLQSTLQNGSICRERSIWQTAVILPLRTSTWGEEHGRETPLFPTRDQL